TKPNVLEELGQGEGDEAEFKPLVALKEGDKKESELIRTAIAFANRKGGSIFFGVGNNGEIEGIENDLKKWAKTDDLKAAADRYFGVLRTLINDVVSFRLTMIDGVIDVGGRLILRLRIAESPEKPVWHLQTKETWI